MVTKEIEITTYMEVIISIDAWNFAPLPHSGNFLSIHGNTSMSDYDSMSFFCSVVYTFTAFQGKRLHRYFTRL
jgi:hypothetical protein